MHAHITQTLKAIDEYCLELNDVSIHFRIDYREDLQHFQQFLHQFLNRLMSDFKKQRTLKSSQIFIENLIEEVTSIQDTLHHELDQNKSVIDYLKTELKNLPLRFVDY